MITKEEQDYLDGLKRELMEHTLLLSRLEKKGHETRELLDRIWELHKGTQVRIDQLDKELFIANKNI